MRRQQRRPIPTRFARPPAGRKRPVSSRSALRRRETLAEEARARWRIRTGRIRTRGHRAAVSTCAAIPRVAGGAPARDGRPRARSGPAAPQSSESAGSALGHPRSRRAPAGRPRPTAAGRLGSPNTRWNAAHLVAARAVRGRRRLRRAASRCASTTAAKRSGLEERDAQRTVAAHRDAPAGRATRASRRSGTSRRREPPGRASPCPGSAVRGVDEEGVVAVHHDHDEVGHGARPAIGPRAGRPGRGAPRRTLSSNRPCSA